MFTQISFLIRLRRAITAALLSAASFGSAQEAETADTTTTEIITPTVTPTAEILPSETTVTGRVVWNDITPEPQRIRVYRDARFCGDKGEMELPTLQVDAKTLGVSGAVVSLTGTVRPTAFTSTSLAEIYPYRFSDCTVLPQLQLVPAGARVEIRSADFVSHDIEIADPAGNPILEHPLIGENDRTVWRTQKPGQHTLRCKLHEWELGYIFVLENQFSVITGADGTFSISNVPRGNYTLTAWHPALRLVAEEKNGRIVGYHPGEALTASTNIGISPPRTLLVNLELNSAETENSGPNR